MLNDDEELLRYYQEELLYLRRDGKTFAQSYPKIAARLELTGHESPDPHVERLIESFAFLTARIRSSLDDDFPEIGAELLDVMYPQYLLTTPSLSIARFDVDPKNTNLTSGTLVPRLTTLFAHGHGADHPKTRTGSEPICRWRTTAPVTLWPIEITAAEFESPGLYPVLYDRSDVARVLRLTVVSHTEPFDKLGLDRLRFHLHGDTSLTHTLYELLLDDSRGVMLIEPSADGGVLHELKPDSLRAGGFGEDEELLPYPPQGHPAYRLLQEYFTFPEKFHFIDVENLAGKVSGKEIHLLFLLSSAPPERMHLKLDRREPRTGLLAETGTFVLGCTPIVNLFEKTSEPIRVDHRRLEYRLVGDMQREKTTEIHSVLSVSGSVNPAHPTRRYEPFYSWSHESSRRAQRIFWHARREMSLDEEVGGTETWLSFVDLDFNPEDPPEETVWAHTLCTNRSLAAQMRTGDPLQTDVPTSGVKIVSLRNPTHEIRPPLGGRTL
jgi:type VI secretion system protein ImpG